MRNVVVEKNVGIRTTSIITVPSTALSTTSTSQVVPSISKTSRVSVISCSENAKPDAGIAMKYKGVLEKI